MIFIYDRSASMSEKVICPVTYLQQNNTAQMCPQRIQKYFKAIKMFAARQFVVFSLLRRHVTLLIRM